MNLLLLFLASHRSYGNPNFILIYSSETENSLVQTLENNFDIHSKFNIQDENYSNVGKYLENVTDPVLLDLTENSEFFPLLDEISKTYGAVYLTLTQNDKIEISEFRFCLKGSLEKEKNSLIEVISYLSWQKFSIFFNSDLSGISLAGLIKSEMNEKVNYFVSLSYDISVELGC